MLPQCKLAGVVWRRRRTTQLPLNDRSARGRSMGVTTMKANAAPVEMVAPVLEEGEHPEMGLVVFEQQRPFHYRYRRHQQVAWIAGNTL